MKKLRVKVGSELIYTVNSAVCPQDWHPIYEVVEILQDGTIVTKNKQTNARVCFTPDGVLAYGQVFRHHTVRLLTRAVKNKLAKYKNHDDNIELLCYELGIEDDYKIRLISPYVIQKFVNALGIKKQLT